MSASPSPSCSPPPRTLFSASAPEPAPPSSPILDDWVTEPWEVPGPTAATATAPASSISPAPIITPTRPEHPSEPAPPEHTSEQSVDDNASFVRGLSEEIAMLLKSTPDDTAEEVLKGGKDGLPGGQEDMTSFSNSILSSFTLAGDIPVDPSPLVPLSNNGSSSRLTLSFALSLRREDVCSACTPFTPAALDVEFPSVVEDALTEVLEASVQVATRAAYGAIVRKYLAFCEICEIPLEQRFPASRTTLARFLASFHGQLRADTVRKHRDGLLFWHSIHGLDFALPKSESTRIFKGLRALEPSGKEQRPPVVVQDLLAVHAQLDLTKGEDACFWAALTVGFFTMSRPGEIALRSKTTFDPNHHASGASVTFLPETEDFPEHATIHLPFDKVRHRKGDDLFVTQQLVDPRLDPITDLRSHLAINAPTKSDFLFSSKPRDPDRTTLYPLTSSWLVSRTNKLLEHAGRSRISGHSFRIGGATFYLMAGRDTEYIRRIGRWRSDAFLIYWQRVKLLTAQHLTDSELINIDGMIPGMND